MLSYVPRSEVDAVWPEVSAGIIEASKKLKCSPDVDDVRAEIDCGKAGLFMVDGGGFLVAIHLTEGKNRIFYGWILYSKNLNGRMPKIIDEVDALARDANCNLIRFQSPRKAWKRLPWFTEKTTVFERATPNV